jgi:eukaryotic-like serine/threonine-protein kinase
MNMKLQFLLLIICASRAAAEPGSWRMVRGDPALLGISESPVTLPVKLAWSFKAGPPVLATPVSDGVRAYVGDGNGVFHAVNLKDGSKAWSYTIIDPKKNQPSRDPIEASACLLGTRVIFGGTDGWVRAFEAATGKEAWSRDTKGEIKGGLTPFARKGSGTPDALVVTGFTGNTVALDAAAGTVLWEYDAGGPVNGAASVSAAGIVFGGCNGTLDVLRLDGTLARRMEIKVYMPNSVAVRDGFGYCAHSGNKVQCYNLAAGTVKWEFHDRDFSYFSSPAVTADRVFIGGDDKRLHCLQRSDGEETWAFRARDKIMTSPVVAGPLVIFGSDDGRVYFIDAATGTEQWSYEIGAPVKSSPAVVDGRVLIGADDGAIYCFAP